MSSKNKAAGEVVEFVPVKRRPEETRFKPGQSGNPNGRPKSSKHKLNEDFVYALSESWSEHGKEVLRRVATEQPVEYLKMMCNLIIKWDLPCEADKQPTLDAQIEALSDDDLELFGQFLRFRSELAERAHAAL